jgi:hypothetical protein
MGSMKGVTMRDTTKETLKHIRTIVLTGKFSEESIEELPEEIKTKIDDNNTKNWLKIADNLPPDLVAFIEDFLGDDLMRPIISIVCAIVISTRSSLDEEMMHFFISKMEKQMLERVEPKGNA